MFHAKDVLRQRLQREIRKGIGKQTIMNESAIHHEVTITCPAETGGLKQLQMGVFFSRRMLTLVMTAGSGKNTPRELVDWTFLPLPEHLDPESDSWIEFFQDSLSRFAGTAGKMDVWCTIGPNDLKVKHITIPDMPVEKIGNAAFWGLKRETDFDETKEIFDFEILEDVVVDGVKKKNLVVFSGNRLRIQSLQSMFDRAGYSLTGITAIPFALQNYFRNRLLEPDAPYFALTHICQETSDIYCFSRSGLILARSLRTGALTLMGELDENPEMAQLFLPDDEPKTPHAISPQVQEVSERLVSKIIRTGDYCAQHYTGNTPITHYYFLGDTGMFGPFMDLAKSMIPGGVRIVEPALDKTSCKDRPALPDKGDERSAFPVALGIALSGHDLTPNFLHTHQDKREQTRRKRIIGTVCLAGVLIFSALIALHLFFIASHNRDLALQNRLDQELARIDKDITPADIEQMIAASREKVSHADLYIDRYRPLGVIFDLCRITPSHIRLTSLAYGNSGTEKEKNRTLRIEGQVTGPGVTLEAELAHYILSLSNSPMFGNIQVTKERTEVKYQQDQLLFSATLEVS